MIDLSGCVALVPGANGHVGSSLAPVLAERGCDVALAYHTRDTEARQALDHALGLGRRARLDRLDASDCASASRWVADVAREFGRYGVTVNVVCPGPIEGAKLNRLRSHGTTGSKIVEELIQRVPMKRAGTTYELASTMAFLASKEGGYITGQAISVSGGLTMN